MHFNVSFKFRNGKTFGVSGERVSIGASSNNSPLNYLYIDGVEMAKLTRGLPNFDQNNDYYLYNATPTKALIDKLPDSWDKTESSLKIIDEIYVNTLQQL